MNKFKLLVCAALLSGCCCGGRDRRPVPVTPVTPDGRPLTTSVEVEVPEPTGSAGAGGSAGASGVGGAGGVSVN